MTEQTIFLAALDIPDPARRAAYVTQSCAGNEDLLRQVESLLAAHDRSGEFLDEPAVEQMGRPNADTVTADATSAPPTDDALTFLQPPTRTGSLGRLARYEVLEVLGRGGFGTVLRVFDDRLHRVIAIKVLAPQLAASGTARARFVREARSAAAVRDEHVVHVYEVTESDEPVPYLVMEYVAGQTLQQKLDRAGPLSVPETLRIGTQIARGLAAAHATGLIHRDVKPSNILLENGVERVKITDFGLARAADDASISHSGMVAGTPMYMSPEQARGEKVDHRADLFSLGSVLYAMCTGRPPFRAATTLAVLKRVAEDEPRPVREINPEVPDWLAAVVAKLHAKDPADRSASANEVADLLARYLGELQTTGTVTVIDAGRAELRERPDDYRIGPLTRLRSPRRRRVRIAVLVALVLGISPALPFVYNKGFSNVSRSLANRADIRFETLWDPNVERVMVTRDGEPVGTIDSGHSTLRVAPGQYQLRVITRPGYRLGQVTIDTSGVGPTMTAGVDHRDGRFDLILYRGDEFRVFMSTESGEDLATVEARNRARVTNNLAEIGRAVNALGAGGWVQLFNGTDLGEWRVVGDPANSWQVRDGHIWGSGAETSLVSMRAFQNFHLRAEGRISPGGSGSIQFRAAPSDAAIRNRDFHPDGFEVKSTPLDSGGRRALDVRLSVDWQPQGGYSDVGPFQADQWVTFDLVARGERITATVGDRTIETTDPDRRLRAGPIIIRLGSRDSVLEFRKIEVMELSAEPPRAVAPFDAARAKELQEAWATHLGVDVELTNSVGMKLRLIPPGEFTMGTGRDHLDRIAKDLREDWQKEALATEAPPRPVRVEAPFYLGECEVPVRAFREFVKATGFRTTAETNGKGGRRHVGAGQIESRPEWTWTHADFTGSEDLPVVEISLKDAEAFCTWLTAKEGRKYVVPNERQWEYACRAGTATRWWNGDAEGDVWDVAWTHGNATFFKPVGGKPGNPFGLRDMHGNVEEVCPVVGGGAVARGGSYGSPALMCRSASRFPIPEDEVWSNRGFRVAIVSDLKPVK